MKAECKGTPSQHRAAHPPTAGPRRSNRPAEVDFVRAKLGAERWSSHVTDPIADVLGDYQAFFAGQKDRLRARGIDISPYPLSHLAYRVPEYDQYLHVRGLLERHAAANHENVWNGRPISTSTPRCSNGGPAGGIERPATAHSWRGDRKRLLPARSELLAGPDGHVLVGRRQIR